MTGATYFFVVQVEYINGQLRPANVGVGPPDLRVCVDTERPHMIHVALKVENRGQ